MLEELPSWILTSPRFMAGLGGEGDSEPRVTIFITIGEGMEVGRAQRKTIANRNNEETAAFIMSGDLII